MGELWDLIVDTESAVGRLATSAAFVVAGVLLAALLAPLAARGRSDPFDKYVARKLVRYGLAIIVVVALAVLWRPFAGRIGVVLGLITAGVAFAMQEVIGALAGWLSIFTGRLYRVGDRVEVGHIRGDVIDITPLRTKVMEMGSALDETSWVGGRQLTGRIVSVSNKAVFTDPVFNYSATFGFLWEELTVPIPYDEDWERAEAIIVGAVQRVSATDESVVAIEQMRRSYPMRAADLEPRVFVRLTDNWVELSARFVVPVRTARAAKDEVSREVLGCLRAAGIEVASATATVTLRSAGAAREILTDEQG